MVQCLLGQPLFHCEENEVLVKVYCGHGHLHVEDSSASDTWEWQSLLGMGRLPSGPSMDTGSVCRKYQAQLPPWMTTARNSSPTETPYWLAILTPCSAMYNKLVSFNWVSQVTGMSPSISIKAQAHLSQLFWPCLSFPHLKDGQVKKLHQVSIYVSFVSCLLDPAAMSENSWKEAASAKVDWLIRILMMRCWNVAGPEPHYNLSWSIFSLLSLWLTDEPGSNILMVKKVWNALT